jgi:hypothetical protein
MTTLALAVWGAGTGTGREGRESYAKDAKENQKIQKNILRLSMLILVQFLKLLLGFNFSNFPSLIFLPFRVLRVTFAPFAAGNPLSPP